MPNSSTEYYNTLTKLENKLIADKKGLRILVDHKGFESLKSDPANQKLIKFSIICVDEVEKAIEVIDADQTNQICMCDAEKATEIIGDGQANLFYTNFSSLMQDGDYINYIEKNWQTVPRDEMLFTPLTIEKINALSPNPTIVPFRLKKGVNDQIKNLAEMHRFYEKGEDPKTGAIYLQTVNRLLSDHIPYRTKPHHPIINFYGYDGEEAFNLDGYFYRPQNFKALTDSLVDHPKMILTGYGMGNNHTAVKLLESVSNLHPEKKIFEIRIYSRSQLNKFIDDYEAGELNCASVILRDFFDPFIKTYRDAKDCNLFAHEFIQEIEKNAKNGQPVNPRSIPSPVISSKMLADGAFEKLFRQEQILDYFDGTCGNYLIITSQFDADTKIMDFYRIHLHGLEIGNRILEQLSKFKIRDLDYGRKEKSHYIFFNRLLSDIDDEVDNGLDVSCREKLKVSFDNIISYWKKDKASEPFRIGIAIVFRKMIFQSLETFLITKAFEGEYKRNFIETFTAEVAVAKKQYDYYFQFLH